MSSVPENHVVAEGRNLRAAVEDAATRLGVPAAMVEHKLDLAHFRTASGGVAGVDTVKIFAWAKNPGDVAPVLEAETWMKGLLVSMGRTGSVRAELRNDAIVVYVDVGEEGRHLVGRQGTTLRAVQHLMEQSIGAQFPGKNFRIEVARADDDRGDDRGRDDRGGRDDRPPRDDRRDDRPPRDDRGPPRDGPRQDDRGPRRDDRGPRRDDRGPRRDDRGDRGDRPRRDDGDVEGLKRLARKVASIVLERGEPEVIRRELNSFDRRIVHLEVLEIPGVASRSVGEGMDRRIEIYASEGGEEPSSAE